MRKQVLSAQKVTLQVLQYTKESAYFLLGGLKAHFGQATFCPGLKGWRKWRKQGHYLDITIANLAKWGGYFTSNLNCIIERNAITAFKSKELKLAKHNIKEINFIKNLGW